MPGDRFGDADPRKELAARPAPGWRTPATGYLSNFRHDVRPLSTGGVLLPEGE